MKFKRWELALALGFVLTLLTGAVWAADVDGQQQALSNKLLRLHVIANSDSEPDQALKLQVRDAVFATASEWVRAVADSQQAEEIILARTDELQAVAQQVVADNGYAYTVAVSVGLSSFPTKEYDGFSLPAGQYRALRVVIGEGRGQNWWCVVFPPLCASAATSKVDETALSAGMTDSEVNLITESDGRYVYRFKCIELWETVKGWFR